MIHDYKISSASSGKITISQEMPRLRNAAARMKRAYPVFLLNAGIFISTSPQFSIIPR
jgi:hypothetical protein